MLNALYIVTRDLDVQHPGQASTRFGGAMKQAHNRERGFSLLEMMVVVGVTAIGLAMAVINTSSLLPSLKANSAMDQVFGQLRAAHDGAITQRRQFQVNFVGDNGFTVTEIEPVGSSPVTTITLGGGAWFMLFNGIPDTPMAFGNKAPVYIGGATGGPAVMNFTTTGGFVDGKGSPTNGTVFLGIPGQPNTARAVTIMGATGRIRQYHWDGKAWQE
jgi:prepilin-type N-terminal cleavage/methylation domain-containing protein